MPGRVGAVVGDKGKWKEMNCKDHLANEHLLKAHNTESLHFVCGLVPKVSV